MRIVLLAHPPSFNSASMPRVTRQLADRLKGRGHRVEIWTPTRYLGRLPIKHSGIQKWFGYVDHLILFPTALLSRIQASFPGTLFIAIDQALGPWVPRIANRPHVVHCNDFLAIRSALGEIAENPTRSTGRAYQRIILRGLRLGKNFISISAATRNDLQRLVSPDESCSHVVHLDLNHSFRPIDDAMVRSLLRDHLDGTEDRGILLQVGGNQWYKNRHGVIELYRAWCELHPRPLPLWMVGHAPTEALQASAKGMPHGGVVRFLTGLNDDQVVAAYNLAAMSLFPSLEEGFGWPIAESMACGTPVLTTDAEPMTEVGGDAAFYHRRWTADDSSWAADGARVIESIVSMNEQQRKLCVEKSLEQAAQFSTDRALDQYEAIYKQVLLSHGFDPDQ